MWEMLEPDLECGNECWGPGPPPEFLIPPPPRPPFLQELTSKCTEDPLPDIEMCEAIPVSISLYTCFVNCINVLYYHIYLHKR